LLLLSIVAAMLGCGPTGTTSDAALTDGGRDGVADGGVPCDEERDTDRDTIPNSTEGIVDTDGDGTPDARDTDADDDGIPNADEIAPGGGSAPTEPPRVTASPTTSTSTPTGTTSPTATRGRAIATAMGSRTSATAMPTTTSSPTATRPATWTCSAARSSAPSNGTPDYL
jgi:hypothetical protein